MTLQKPMRYYNFGAFCVTLYGLWKISNSGATRCQILKLKCTKFDYRWKSAPEPDTFNGGRWKKGEGKGIERRKKGMEERGGR